jgi:hypothetical protein
LKPVKKMAAEPTPELDSPDNAEGLGNDRIAIEPTISE